MKTSIKILLFLFMLQLSSTVFSSEDIEDDTSAVPENALLLSHSSTERGVLYTLIDLENNEMVIIIYGLSYGSSDFAYFKFRKVIRTGITIDPDKQMQLMNYNQEFYMKPDEE